MELGEECVDLVSVPGWLSTLWLQQPDGAIVGEIQPDSTFLSFLDKTTEGASSSKPVNPTTPTVFEQVVLRQAINTFTVEGLGLEDDKKGKKKVHEVKNILNLRPKDVDDPAYVSLTNERQILAKEAEKRSLLVDARPQERVVTSVGDQNMGAGKRRRK